MNRELDEKLCSTYPDIFRERNLPIIDSAMGRGFSHNNGWYELLDRLCAELTEVQKATGIEVIATQVKEKFGTLRFYYDLNIVNIRSGLNAEVWERIVHGIVMYSERHSKHICEKCGRHSPGIKESERGLVNNLCDDCRSRT